MKQGHLLPSYLRGYSKNLPLLDKVALAVMAETYLHALKKRIKDQPADVPALSRGYKDDKARGGYDPRIWVRTGFFLNNLKIAQVRKGVLFVGATGLRHKPSGMTMSQLAAVFEYGDVARGIPPRPLFRPTNARIKGALVTKLGMVSGAFFAKVKP